MLHRSLQHSFSKCSLQTKRDKLRQHKIVSKKNSENELLAKKPVFVSKAVKTKTPC